MVNLSQARSNILPQNFLTGCFLIERIETQNLGKDQTFPAFPAVAALRFLQIFLVAFSEYMNFTDLDYCKKYQKKLTWKTAGVFESQKAVQRRPLRLQRHF